MVSFSQKIIAEIENVKSTLLKLHPVLEVENKDFPELAAIATILQNFYNGVENILKQILLSKNIIVEKSDNWHKDLLEKVDKHTIISEQLKHQLYEYLIFRHYFIHSYAICLEETQLLTLTDKLEKVWSQFLFEIRPYFE